MKKNYRKPKVAVINLQMEQLLNSMSEQPVYEITTDPEIKGQGNGFWQAPGASEIIDDEE